MAFNVSDKLLNFELIMALLSKTPTFILIENYKRAQLFTPFKPFAILYWAKKVFRFIIYSE